MDSRGLCDVSCTSIPTIEHHLGCAGHDVLIVTSQFADMVWSHHKTVYCQGVSPPHVCMCVCRCLSAESSSSASGHYSCCFRQDRHTVDKLQLWQLCGSVRSWSGSAQCHGHKRHSYHDSFWNLHGVPPCVRSRGSIPAEQSHCSAKRGEKQYLLSGKHTRVLSQRMFARVLTSLYLFSNTAAQAKAGTKWSYSMVKFIGYVIGSVVIGLPVG